jgi:CDP-glycerol glycerophosphotransferase (TagB/SpsB family)
VAIHDSLRRIGRERLGVYNGMFLKRLAEWPLRAFMRRVGPHIRRSPDLIAFGSVRNRFADNPAYLFLAMGRDPDLRCVWITGSRDVIRRLRELGYDARHRWSLSGIKAALSASMYVYGFGVSDINVWFNDGAVRFNLWHGVGVKRIERDRLAPWDKMYSAPAGSLTARVFADDRTPPDWLLTTSRSMSTYFARPFGISPERCVELGYPRNDHLITGDAPPSVLIDRAIYERLAAAPFVVGYFPTWRYESFSALPAGAPDLDAIASVVGAQGGVVLFKSHHQSVTPVATNRESLVVLPSDADLNAYLSLCEVLITDYSSVAGDFLLLDRPIITFAPSLDDDLAKDSFSVDDPLSLQPGRLVRTADELYGVLRDVRSIRCAENFDHLRAYYWAASSGGSARAIGQFIKRHVDRSSPAALFATSGAPGG